MTTCDDVEEGEGPSHENGRFGVLRSRVKSQWLLKEGSIRLFYVKSQTRVWKSKSHVHGWDHTRVTVLTRRYCTVCVQGWVFDYVGYTLAQEIRSLNL